jgi:hypothetical protein
LHRVGAEPSDADDPENAVRPQARPRYGAS